MRNKRLVVAGVLTALGVAVPTVAQEGSATLEEVIVTAEKREANLQDAAVAVAAYQGDLLQAMDINDAQSLILADPSMSFSRAGGEGRSSFAAWGPTCWVSAKTPVSRFIRTACTSADRIWRFRSSSMLSEWKYCAALKARFMAATRRQA